jgi:hypothetical protein
MISAVRSISPPGAQRHAQAGREWNCTGSLATLYMGMALRALAAPWNLQFACSQLDDSLREAENRLRGDP